METLTCNVKTFTLCYGRDKIENAFAEDMMQGNRSKQVCFGTTNLIEIYKEDTGTRRHNEDQLLRIPTCLRTRI